MERLCVFCGSSPGRGSIYLDAARRLARSITRAGLGLVYGGAGVGVMGALADAALAEGGEVTGVLPGRLVERERGHAGLTRLHVVADMHERKAMMGSLSDGFIALPGGLGTLEELFEVLTWNQLGIHRKPCGLLNVSGYFDGLAAFIDHAVEEGFVPETHRSYLLMATDPDDMLEAMRAFRGPASG